MFRKVSFIRSDPGKRKGRLTGDHSMFVFPYNRIREVRNPALPGTDDRQPVPDPLNIYPRMYMRG